MSEAQAREMAAGYELHVAWRQDNAQFEADAAAFWERLSLLPKGADPAIRAKELAAVAYQDGKLVAVSTLAVGRIEQLRAKVAMLRAATDPEHRRSHLANALSIFTREVIESWSRDNPEARIAGMGAVIESENLKGREKEPVWPTTKMVLIGYTPKGQQLRLYWFPDFRLD
jgi:hypothetical protein